MNSPRENAGGAATRSPRAAVDVARFCPSGEFLSSCRVGAGGGEQAGKSTVHGMRFRGGRAARTARTAQRPSLHDWQWVQSGRPRANRVYHRLEWGGPQWPELQRKGNFLNAVCTIRPKIQWGGDVGATDFGSGGEGSVTSATNKGFSSRHILEIRGRGGAVNGSRGASIGI